MSSDSNTDIDDAKLDELAEEFLARYREGQRPSLSEFVARHPDMADEIRDLFPTLTAMEEARVSTRSSAAGAVTSASSGAPERIGEYRILREVRRGGMGIVYEAIQESLGRHVALKILPTHSLLDPRQLQRFQREARAAARLHHTNIVPVFGVGVHEGLNYYAMQFIRGQGLDQLLHELKQTSSETKRNDQPADQANASGTKDFHLSKQNLSSSFTGGRSTYWLGVARIGSQVADALAYAHSQGVLHRDIKPSNLLLDGDGIVWVTDFGLAKDTSSDSHTDGQADLTKTGDIVGTLRYMAPEVLRGHSDQRSDIYSLGATLYELVTLRPAFDEADRKVFMRRLLHDEPARPRSYDANIPFDLETIVVKAIAKDPEDRYSSAVELAEDLRRFIEDRPIRARRISTWERAWRLCRRNPLIASLSVIVALLIATLSVGVTMAGWIRAERDRAVHSASRAQKAEQSAQASLQRALDAERDANVRAHLTQAIVQRKRDLPGRRTRGIEEIEAAIALGPSAAMKQELRNELVATLALTDTGPAKVWEVPFGAFAVDTQFQHYAHLSRDGIISLRRMSDDQQIRKFQRPPGPDSRASLKFSPDGNYLASFTFDQHVMVWQVDNGQLVLNDEGCGWEPSYDFTPDSRCIILGHDREVIVKDLKSQQVRTQWPVEFAAWSVSCAPTGDLVAITPEGDNSSRKLQVFHWPTGRLIAEHIAPKWVFDIAWHPTGSYLAFGCNDTNIYLWDIRQAAPYRKLEGSLAMGVRVAFSHDGQLLASSSWGQEFYLWEPNTGELLCSGRYSLNPLHFSPDDTQIGLLRDGTTIGTVSITLSNTFRYFARGGDRGEGNSMLNAVFNKDERLLMIGTEKGISICEYPSGQERAFAPIGRAAYLRCDSAGNLLVASSSLVRWPLQRADGAESQYILGPPQPLNIPARGEFDIDGVGDVLVVSGYDEAAVIHIDQPDNPVNLSPHEDCRYVAISRDGNLVATASHFGSKAKIWDAHKGTLLATIPVESSWAKFSPDGRWLATPVGARHLWKVGTWDPGPDLGGLVAGFSEDGRMVAVDNLAGSVLLLDPDTGREYVRLEHPKGFGADRYLFTSDGRELLAVSTARPSGFAWSLDRIREELASRGLDWTLPPLPRSEQPRTQGPIEVQLRTGNDQAQSREELARAHIARCRARLEANPDDASTCNELAWELLIAPGALQDANEAVRLASHALSIRPTDANCRNTLGAAYYRTGKFREAVECLTPNLTTQNDLGLPFDLYFLAMSHHELGQHERAEELITWANRWSEKLTESQGMTSLLRQQLTEIRQEAERLVHPK